MVHNQHEDSNGADIFQYLRSMKEDITNQNSHVTSEISSMNCKIDSLLSTVNGLKLDCDQMKHDNRILQDQVSMLESKLDQHENNSRRDNLRFHGICGKINEKWSETEQKLSDFLKTNLNMGEEADTIEIDRAHRLKSKDENKLQS